MVVQQGEESPLRQRASSHERAGSCARREASENLNMFLRRLPAATGCAAILAGVPCSDGLRGIDSWMRSDALGDALDRDAFQPEIRGDLAPIGLVAREPLLCLVPVHDTHGMTKMSQLQARRDVLLCPASSGTIEDDMEAAAKTLATNLRRLIKHHGQTNAIASERTGIAVRQLQRILAAHHAITLDTLDRIAAAYRILPHQLLMPGLDPAHPSAEAIIRELETVSAKLDAIRERLGLQARPTELSVVDLHQSEPATAEWKDRYALMQQFAEAFLRAFPAVPAPPSPAPSPGGPRPRARNKNKL